VRPEPARGATVPLPAARQQYRGEGFTVVLVCKLCTIGTSSMAHLDTEKNIGFLSRLYQEQAEESFLQRTYPQCSTTRYLSA